MTLKEIRLSKKLTQQQAADLLHVSRRTYINYEQSKYDMKSPRFSYIFETLENYGRIDETHGVLDIKDIRSVGSSVLQKYDVDFCYLFGSYAKGQANEKSDVDIFVSMPVRSTDFYDMVECLREKLHKKVDVVHETQLVNNLELTKEIMKDGIKIYG